MLDPIMKRISQNNCGGTILRFGDLMGWGLFGGQGDQWCLLDYWTHIKPQNLIFLYNCQQSHKDILGEGG